MILAGGMAPGVGAHYQLINAEAFKGINPDGSVNPEYPASWIYASTANNAPVVGVMYESLNATAPSGFIGPNDHWHRHSNVCVQFNNGKIGVPFAADQNVTPQECADVHGDFMKKTVWMVHAWVVPGWESPRVCSPTTTCTCTARGTPTSPTLSASATANPESGVPDWQAGRARPTMTRLRRPLVATMPRLPRRRRLGDACRSARCSHCLVTGTRGPPGPDSSHRHDQLRPAVQPDDGGLVVLNSQGSTYRSLRGIPRQQRCRPHCRPRWDPAPTYRTTQ